MVFKYNFSLSSANNITFMQTKNSFMKTLKPLLLICFLAIANQESFAQCFPASAATVFGTTSGINGGTETFANMPTGTVIELVAPVDNTSFFIDFCPTNPGAGPYPSGTNDGYVTILDANNPGANNLGTGNDGCTNVDVPRYGPPVFTFVATTAGTYYLYLTEYVSGGNDPCFGSNGSNSAYIAEITTTLPQAVDVALNSTIGFSKIPVFLKNAVNFTVNAINLGFNATTYNVTSSVYQLPGQASNFNTSATLSINDNDTVFNVATANVSALSAAGNYRVQFVADANNDNIETNDTAFYDFKLTTDIYSRGTDAPSSSAISTTVPGETLGFLQPFAFNSNVLISEIYFEKSNRGSQPVLDSVQAIILQTNANGKPGTLFYSSPMKLASTLSNGRVGIGIPSPVSLPSGTYFIGFRNILDTSGIGVFTICEDNYEPNTLYVFAPSIGAGWLSLDSISGGNPTFNFCMDIQVAEDPNVGINEMRANDVFLYPNPANNKVNIVLQSSVASPSKVCIFNIAGKLLSETTLTANTQQTTLDVTNFSNGIYIVEITNQTGKINKKLSISK